MTKFRNKYIIFFESRAKQSGCNDFKKFAFIVLSKGKPVAVLSAPFIADRGVDFLKRKVTTAEKDRMTRVLYVFVLFSFIIPIAFLVYRIIVTKQVGVTDADYRSVADYALMLLECVLGVVVIHIPSFLSKKFNFKIPRLLFVMYIVFLYCAIFLGEVRDFYYHVPHWDVVLHCFSSVMAGSFGFMVVAILNRDEHTAMNLSPFFVSLFAFCFAVTIGAVWEIYEFSFDGLLGLNMQKFMLENGTKLVGRAAVVDTMKDIIVDTVGALISSAVGYFSLKHEKGWANEIIQNPESLSEK